MLISAASRSEENCDWIHVAVGEDEWDLFPSEAMDLLRALVRAMSALTPDDVGECLSCGGQGFMVRDGISDRYCIRCVSCSRQTEWLSREGAMEAWDRLLDDDDGRDEP